MTFDSFYDNVLVGRELLSRLLVVWALISLSALVGEDLVLSADATTTTHLSGRIIPQSGSDLNIIGQLFSNYLAGDNLTLVAKGVSVQPPGSSSTVSWLSTAFATLALDVILPGEKLDVCTHSFLISHLRFLIVVISRSFNLSHLLT